MKKTFKFLFSVFMTSLILCAAFTAAAAEAPVAVASTEFFTGQGKTFTTTVYIPDDANIADFDISLRYDTEIITLVSAEENEDINGFVVFNCETPGLLIMNYSRASGNVTKRTPILDLTFEVDDNAGVGVYDCLTVDRSETYLAHRLNDSGTLNEVDFECDFAKLIIYETGDVDLSCSVDIADATYIRRYLAKFDGAALSEFKLALADTYCDNIVDIADAVCLQQRLAKLLNVVYGNRINVIFYADGNKYATKSVVYDGTLKTIPTVPLKDDYSKAAWSLSASEYIAPIYSNLKEDVEIHAYYDPDDKINPAIEYYKALLTDKYYSGDLPTNMSGDLALVDRLDYQNGRYALLVWKSDCNYVLNQTSGKFIKPTYPQDLSLTVKIISYDANNTIDGKEEISFNYQVPGIYQCYTKAEVKDFLKHYFTDDKDKKYRVNYDVKLISKLNHTILTENNKSYDDSEIRLDWYQNVDGELVPISQIKRLTSPQVNDYVAVATFNGKPLEDDGKIYIDDVEVTAIEEIEIKNYIINQIAAEQGTLATEGIKLWNKDSVYGTTVTWESGNAEIGYVANNAVELKSSAVSGSILPLIARVSYGDGEESHEFTLSYNLTVSCNNTKIKYPENMDEQLYKAIKAELEENLGYRGDLTSAALGDIRFVNLDLGDYPDITSLRGLSYCSNLRTLNISGLHITDGTMNQIATLSYLEAFVARGCELDNLSDGGAPTLKNAVNLKLLDLTDNNFESLDSVFAEGVKYGKLRQVYLSNNRLKDINALSRAPMMTYLSLSGNGLDSEGAAAVANYPALLYLSLANNEIEDVSHISGLKNLKELRLQHNKISDVRELRKLINLEILYLGHNDIQDIGCLNTLRELSVFYVNDNKIGDISSALESFTKLEAINVSGNEISSLSALIPLKETLTEIYAENNKLTDFSFIDSASKLHILMLAGNKTEFVQSNMSAWLGSLTEMEVLTLSGIKLNDLSFLTSMEKLVRLDIADCGVSAFNGETSNVALIADKYATLKALNISDNDMRGDEDELLKLGNINLLTVFYADNICNELDAYRLTYQMPELRYISLENCGIKTANWLSKYDGLAYVDLAGNNVQEIDLNTYLSNASQKTIRELYLDTNAENCRFTDAYRIADFGVKKLSLENVGVEKVEYLPYMDNLEYLNVSDSRLTSLTGDDPELAEMYSIERYSTLETLDVSGLDVDISVLKNMESVKTAFAVGAADGKLFYKGNLNCLKYLNDKKKVTCYLYDKKTKYEPNAEKEGTAILNLLEKFPENITVAAEKISDNNPAFANVINDYEIVWSVSNDVNYEIVDEIVDETVARRLAVRNYDKIDDESLTITAAIEVYPPDPDDQNAVHDFIKRDFTIDADILRATPAYYAINADNYSQNLERGDEFTYDLTLKAAETDGFSDKVTPVENRITYSYSTVNLEIPYVNVFSVNDKHEFKVKDNAPLGATVTIEINIAHDDASGESVVDVGPIIAPVTVASRTFTATFEKNGGSLIDSNSVEYNLRKCVEDSPIFEGLTLSKLGYRFDGWYEDAGFNTLFSEDGGDAVMPPNDITLYAKWTALSYNVIFDANGGEVSPPSLAALSDAALGELPIPIRNYYTFDGWFTEAEGGTQVTSDDKFARTTDLTLYAHWTLNSFVVTFDANGGTVSPASLRGYCGQELGELPTPTRDYYTFRGWHTAANGGTEVTSTNVLTQASDFVVFAHWVQNPVSEWTLKSAVPADAQVIETKYSYTQTYYKEDKAQSLDGWTCYDSYWVQCGSGSKNFAGIPNTFDGNHNIYKNFALSQPYFPYENATNKREVSISNGGFVYWHWMYNVPYANTTKRAISGKKLKTNESLDGYAYTHFYAFTSTSDCPYLGTGYCNNQKLDSYNCHNILPAEKPLGVGTPRFLRFKYSVCKYIDFYKMFKYTKHENLESATYPAGSNISNVQEWVKYIPKTATNNIKKSKSVEYNGHTYKLYTTSSPILWDAAKSYCEKNGGYLATLTTAEENDAVKAIVNDSNAWIGAYRAPDGVNFVWTTGENFSYTDWKENEPNNAEGVENYVGFFEGQWNDYPNDSLNVNAFVIEIE